MLVSNEREEEQDNIYLIGNLVNELDFGILGATHEESNLSEAHPLDVT